MSENLENKNSENTSKTPTKTQKLWKQNLLSIVCMVVVSIGALGVGVCLILSEILYPKIESFFECPAWYQMFMYISLAVAFGGIIGCGFTKNRLNTAKTEFRIELITFCVGFGLMLFCALARTESYVKDVFICIGGAVSSVGFFCGIGSLIGRLKKPSNLYASVYIYLINFCNLDYTKFPKNKPAKLMQIIKVEKFFGTPLPNELIDFLLEFSGDGSALFSTDEIIKTTTAIREKYKDTKVKDANNFCFFGKNSEGDYFCYKILDNGSIKDNEIYLWDHETNKTKLLTNSLSELIKKYYNDEM